MRSTRILTVLGLVFTLLHLSNPTAAQTGDDQNLQSYKLTLVSVSGSPSIDGDAGGCSTRCGIAFIPNRLTFAPQPVATTSKPLSIRLLNSLPTSTTVGAVSTTGPFHATTTCPKTLPRGNSCFFAVTFRPLVKGAVNGAMHVTVGGVAYSLPFSGTGN
jgi:hypothetical protein